MINRRSILKAIGSVTALGTPGVSGLAAKAALSASAAAGAMTDIEGEVAVREKHPTIRDVNDDRLIPQELQDLLNDLHDDLYESATEDRSMDVDIRTKKSWSPVFKHHIYKHRRLELRRLERQVYRQKELNAKLMKAMGIKK